MTIRLLQHRTADHPSDSDRHETLQALIAAQADRHSRHLLRQLLPLLLPGESPLCKLPPAAALDLALAALELMTARREDFAFRLHPGGGASRYLLINGPDSPQASATLQLLPVFRDGRIKLVSYIALSAERDERGLSDIVRGTDKGTRDVLIIIRLENSADYRREIEHALQLNLTVYRHYAALQSALHAVAPGYLSATEGAVMLWLRQGAFQPLAYRRWRQAPSGDWSEDESARLGLPPGGTDAPLCPTGWFDSVRWSRLLGRQSALTVCPTAWASPVYRREPLIYLGIRLRGSGGPVEHGWLGLFSTRAQAAPALTEPAVLRKAALAVDLIALPQASHDFDRLLALFNVFPKLPLFLADSEQLHLIARSLLQVLSRPEHLKLVLLAGTGPGLLNLVALQPKTLHRPEHLAAMAAWLCTQLSATLQECRTLDGGGDRLGLYWSLELPETDLTLDLSELERGLNRIGRPWEHRLWRLLRRLSGAEQAGDLLERYRPDTAEAYRSGTPPKLAARDLLQLRDAAETGTTLAQLCRYPGSAKLWYLRLCGHTERYLDEVLPHLENLGLRVADHSRFRFTAPARPLYLDSFCIHAAAPGALPLNTVAAQLLETLTLVLAGAAESDGLNRLVPVTGLDWRTIDLLRGYRNYALQLKPRYTVERFHGALCNNPAVTLQLVRYFRARFDPHLGPDDPTRREDEVLADLRVELATSLAAVADGLEDHILRELFNLMDATLRTSFYRPQAGEHRLAFKLDSLGLLQIPHPKPRYEIYVHARHMEGIHLRSGRVARGGIRWSDRPDDFRIEILGLLRTQNVKNALIVPHGAKGGFVVKPQPGTNTAESAKAAYRTLIRALLDLTDNLEDGRPVGADGIITYDQADPYLVVAADKGTATFSDTANELAAERGFWLGDAFASGGSRGYDHKALGITARGAWECVRRHFAELDRDADCEPLTVVGIGSMDGDVFGNGMLLSRNLRLLAAFDGRHIFLDPAPDPALAWSERKRLFELPGSTWNDYDRSRLSPGGGVYPRTAKDIPLGAPVRSWLGTHQPVLDGDELVRLLLSAPMDLLWLGGIGTYVKASSEVNEIIGDRANDGVRIDAAQLRAAVVAEGANLGFTQRARIEYALGGGRINTDAVDNSAGVDLSDHEVNLKILLDQWVHSGLIADTAERDRRLADLTETVCAMVLGHNVEQSLCISLDLERCAQQVEPFLEVLDRLDNASQLDRVAEGLPNRHELLQRHQPGLTRPELAVLMQHAKLALKKALLQRPDSLATQAARALYHDYFPEPLRDQDGALLAQHPLAAEITATAVANHIINRAGAGFLAWAHDLSDPELATAANRYLAREAELQPAAAGFCYRALLERAERIRTAWLQGDP